MIIVLCVFFLDTYGQSPIHEYPELDNSKVSDDEENLNYVDGTENTDVKQCYLETDIPPSIPPHLNHKEPKLKEGNNEHKINYLQTDTPKSNLNVASKDVKQVIKKSKSSSQLKIAKIRGDNELKKEKLNELGIFFIHFILCYKVRYFTMTDLQRTFLCFVCYYFDHS